ncbi:MAG: hypothetical protein LBV12_06760 [Puniceicoccales bacterium]|nr:hypothetical protein [Puniceicoccales bacterium]
MSEPYLEAENHPESPEEPLKLRKKWSWSNFGGDGFLVSLALHIVLALIAIFWVYKTLVVAPPEDPTTFATGAGGGTGGEKRNNFEHRITPKNARSMVKTPNKITVKGASSSIALPDMPNMGMSAFESGALMGGSSKGIGGGAGGGEGTGIGVGRGGGRNFVSLSSFGAFNRQPNTLEGTLYDLKRNREGKNYFDFGNTAARMEATKDALQGIRRNGFKKEYLDSKYFQAEQKLYSTHIGIPAMNANIATRAFDCEKEIQAPGWLAYYEGWITPQEAGEYRFAGMGDDTMIVAVDQKFVFWAFWPEGGRQTWFPPAKDWEPQNAYKAGGSLPSVGQGGRYFGSWFPMLKGRTYKVQIIFSESAGGLFSAELQIQQRKTGAKDGAVDNNVELPLFKLAPISDEEMKLKGSSSQKWTREGPNFGCEINNVRTPRSSASTRR